MISVIGAANRDSLLGHVGLRMVYSPIIDSIGVVLKHGHDIDNEYIKKEVIDGFLIVSSDGNAVYMGKSGLTGNIPRWARIAIDLASEAGGVELAESPSLSYTTRAWVKEIEELASPQDIVSIAAGFNTFRGKRRIWPGTLSAVSPGELMGTVGCWEFKKGHPEPPLVFLTDGKVNVKWGCYGKTSKIEEIKIRKKVLTSMPARWVWKELKD